MQSVAGPEANLFAPRELSQPHPLGTQLPAPPDQKACLGIFGSCLQGAPQLLPGRRAESWPPLLWMVAQAPSDRKSWREHLEAAAAILEPTQGRG